VNSNTRGQVMRFLHLDILPGSALVGKIYSGFWLSRTCNQMREGALLQVPKFALSILTAVVPGAAIVNCFDAAEDKQPECFEVKAAETIPVKNLDVLMPPLETFQAPAAVTARPTPSA
jgi:hypothetical protein